MLVMMVLLGMASDLANLGNVLVLMLTVEDVFVLDVDVEVDNDVVHDDDDDDDGVVGHGQ